MAVEIERKFLVRSEAWRNLVTAEASIRQGYLASGERSTTRVRIKNGSDATVTIKSKRAELRRLEIECPISVIDAETLLSLRHSGLIEKARFTVPWHGHSWGWTYSQATIVASSLPRSSFGMKTRPSSGRRGLGSKLPDSRSTTMGPWRDSHSASGQVSALLRPSVDRLRKGEDAFSVV